MNQTERQHPGIPALTEKIAQQMRDEAEYGSMYVPPKEKPKKSLLKKLLRRHK